LIRNQAATFVSESGPRLPPLILRVLPTGGERAGPSAPQRFGSIGTRVDVGDRLPAGVPHDIAARHLIGSPGRWEAVAVWFKALLTHEKPPEGKIWLAYMLKGGSDASNEDPFTPTAGNRLRLPRQCRSALPRRGAGADELEKTYTAL
jgi:hypothetical protein